MWQVVVEGRVDRRLGRDGGYECRCRGKHVERFEK